MTSLTKWWDLRILLQDPLHMQIYSPQLERVDDDESCLQISWCWNKEIIKTTQLIYQCIIYAVVRNESFNRNIFSHQSRKICSWLGNWKPAKTHLGLFLLHIWKLNDQMNLFCSKALYLNQTHKQTFFYDTDFFLPLFQ